MNTDDPRLAAFAELLAVIDRLRDRNGCPWDRDQSLESMAPSLLEETHEAIDAITSGRRAAAAGELGDLLMNVLLACRIAQDAGDFSLADVSRAIADKLVRRHPHVFADGDARTVDAVLEKWESIKRQERAGDDDRSALAGIPAALPSLLKAQRMGEKAARTGFRWKDVAGALAKLDEEVAELKRSIAAKDGARAIDEEIGDVLFCVVNVARHAGVDAETALRRAASRFGERFRRIESEFGERLKTASADELEAAWRSAKRAIAEDRARVPDGAPDEWRAAAARMDRSGRRVLDLVRDLPADLCARRPDAAVAAWSIDEVLEHLVLVLERVGGGLAKRLAAAGELPSFPPEGLALHPPKRRLAIPPDPVVAPTIVTPASGKTRAHLLPRFSAARDALLALLPRLVAVNPRALTFPHPLFGDVDALQWFEFIAMHEERHAAQIERIRRSFANG